MASSAAPAGELSLCFAHVSAPKAGDVERKAVNELVVRRTERFECEQVYEGSDHARCFADMFGLELEPGADRPEVLRAAVEDAMSVAVLFLGAYDQSKPALFHGRGYSGVARRGDLSLLQKNSSGHSLLIHFVSPLFMSRQVMRCLRRWI